MRPTQDGGSVFGGSGEGLWRDDGISLPESGDGLLRGDPDRRQPGGGYGEASGSICAVYGSFGGGDRIPPGGAALCEEAPGRPDGVLSWLPLSGRYAQRTGTGGKLMLNYEEELKKFKPSLEVEDIEDAVYQEDLTDMSDLLKQVMDQKK